MWKVKRKGKGRVWKGEEKSRERDFEGRVQGQPDGKNWEMGKF